jgi:hypothetical protein
MDTIMGRLCALGRTQLAPSMYHLNIASSLAALDFLFTAKENLVETPEWSR